MCLSSTDGRGVTLHEERACFLWLHTPPTGDAAHVWVSIVRLQSMTYRYSQSRLQRVRVLSVLLRVRTSALCDFLAACTSALCFVCSVYECAVFCLQLVRVHRVLLSACTSAPCFACSMHECTVFCLQHARVHRVLLAACTSAPCFVCSVYECTVFCLQRVRVQRRLFVRSALS